MLSCTTFATHSPLLQVIGMVLQHGDATLQNKAVDILLSSVSHDPTTLRSHMLQESGRALFSQLLQLMIDSSDAGLQEQILEVCFCTLLTVTALH